MPRGKTEAGGDGRGGAAPVTLFAPSDAPESLETAIETSLAP